VPVLPTPTQIVEGKGVAEPISEPKAAKPRKAGPAKGKAKTANAKHEANDDTQYRAKSKEPKAAATKAKQPKVSSKRKGKGR
jgi:hypothetical protein